MIALTLARLSPAVNLVRLTGLIRWAIGRVYGLALCALLLGTMLSPVVLAEPDFPDLSGRIVDRANLLDTGTSETLDKQLSEHETATSNQIVVVTVPSLQGYEISDFSNQLGRYWGIGQADRDNGILLLVAPAERKVRIEVGYGLEGALTDALSGDIIRRQILPLFREDDYAGGIQNGVNSIISAIDGEYIADPDSASRRTGKTLHQHFPLFFIALIALAELLKRFGKRYGMNKIGNSAFPAALSGIAITAISDNLLFGMIAAIVVGLLAFYFRNKSDRTNGGQHTGLAREERDNDNRGSSMGGGGSFGGGGGSFGGGGASGGW